jgi:hypothetical protein
MSDNKKTPETTSDSLSSSVVVSHDTPKCEKCASRTALVTGRFIYSFDAEPYTSGVKGDIDPNYDEDYEGDCWAGAFKCDNCGHIQGMWHE